MGNRDMCRTLCFFALLLAFGCARKLEKESNPAKNRRSGRNSPDKEPPESVCYDPYGCFSNRHPWFSSIVRPLPLPMDPEIINPRFILYDRKTIDPEHLGKNPFNTGEKTVIIIHGFASDSNATWLRDLSKAILRKNVDANVLLLDWAGGANKMDYLQAASNTRVMGAVLARLLQTLVKHKQVTPNKIHCIGHCLGAHICGYMGKRMIKHGLKIDWITALDPAGPGFESADPQTRLTKKDARFVDAIHTNALPVIPAFGFGMIEATGSVDLYMNGGAFQPGCHIKDSLPKLESLKDLANYDVETIKERTECAHARAVEYYISSLGNCKFFGSRCYTCPVTVKWLILGREPPVKQCRRNDTNCQVLGLEARHHAGRGSFYLETSTKPPFCVKKRSKIMAATVNENQNEPLSTDM